MSGGCRAAVSTPGASRGGPPVGKAARRGRAGARRPGSSSLEHRILLTATLCLLAFGAVMVYSASSATTLLQGHGYGSELPGQVRRSTARSASS